MPQGPYLNQMLRVETALGPRALLEALLAVEQGEGRVRAERWGPRTLDCDLVLYGEQRVDLPDLKVPHPEIANRPFWLKELRELGLASDGAEGRVPITEKLPDGEGGSGYQPQARGGPASRKD